MMSDTHAELSRRISALEAEIELYKKEISSKDELLHKTEELSGLLKESEEKFRALAEKSDDLIIRFDKEMRHLYVNPATEKYLGIEANKFIGKTHKELGFPEEEYSYWDSRIHEVFEKGIPTKEASVMNEGTLWFDWSLIPEFNVKGEVETVLSYSRDITDIKNAEKEVRESEKKYRELAAELQKKNAEYQQLNEEFTRQNKELNSSNEKLSELNVTKDKLFGIIGHDLRGPIGGFKALIDLMVTDFDLTDTESVKEILIGISTNANATFDLLENLLLWARSQQNEIIFSPEMLNLHRLIEACLAVQKEQADKKQITLHHQVPSTAQIPADRNMLMTIIRNLVSNAIKFTPEHGNIYISSEEADGYYVLSIKDEGVGIPPKNLNVLFDPREHISTHGTDGEKGSGLGLVLCKEFIEKHGGKIEAESEQGKGSTFSIYLPLGNR